MNFQKLVLKKVKKQSFSDKEIDFIISQIVNKKVSENLICKLLEAIYKNNLSLEEAYFLTKAMFKYSKHIDFRNYSKNIIDKHSTGGVGDKVSLILLPILASCGLKIAKLSGKSLGFTGGTIDKLHSIGLKTSLNINEMKNLLDKNNFFIAEQTDDFVPADKILYRLRNKTKTVNNYGLIASSVLSKKFSILGTKIFIDLKYGTGSFCSTYQKALILSKYMKYIAKRMNRELIIIISNMNHPLGDTVGNSLEVNEAIKFLSNDKNTNYDLQNLIYQFASIILQHSFKNITYKQASKKVKDSISSGKAKEKFFKWISLQHGNISLLNKKNFLNAKKIYQIKAWKNGYLKFTSVALIGQICHSLWELKGKNNDKIDMNAGLYFKSQVGQKLSEGDTIVSCYTNNNISYSSLLNQFKKSIQIVSKKFKIEPMIRKVIYD